MKSKTNLILGVLIALVIVAYLSLYTVFQTEQAIILRLGKIEADAKGVPMVVSPGLHMKIPFMDQVYPFDMRLRTLPIDSKRIFTAEKQQVIVDLFVKWRIKNIVTYYKSTTGNTNRADILLRNKIVDSLVRAFGKQTILEVVAGSRENVMKNILVSADNEAKSIGIQVIDVRLKRIELPDSVADSVYARMRSDRQIEAASLRAEGKKQSETIRSAADANVTVTLATARSNSAKIRAEGVAKSAKIYADTYQKDPDFYAFYRSLEAYNDVFNQHHATLVLSPKGDFFHYFNHIKGVAAQSAKS